MSANVIPFPQAEVLPSIPIVNGGDRRAAVAAERTRRDAKEIERLPFDLSVLEEEGLFVNVDATGFGILDRRLDWQALGVELPEKTDVAFRPPRCGLLPNRYRRQILTPVSQAHAALHKYSYRFRLTETLFESPAYRWIPWQAFTEFETVFNNACDNLNKAQQTVLDAYDEIRDEVAVAFNQVAADSVRRLAATNATVPADFEYRLINWALNAFPTRDELRNKLALRFQVGVILLGSEMLREQRMAAEERRLIERAEADRRIDQARAHVEEGIAQRQLWAAEESARRRLEAEESDRRREAEVKERIRQMKIEAAREKIEETLNPLQEGAAQLRTVTDIENVLAKAIISGSGLTAEALPVILDEKKSVIKGTGALTYTHPEPADNLGGYHNLRRILTEAAATFTPAARAYGVEPMKGLLMVGLPGCGKDLTKKIASSVLGKSLLDLDFGSVMGEGGGVIGSSAITIKRALSIATTLKGILGISEFEKAVGGLESSAKTDGGETARTIAYLLNWMQEQSDVFVIGTANDVRGLAAEQTRQGRFSHIVFVDLPKPDDRREIFAVHLRKRNRSPEDFDLDELAEVTEGYSGAEIEAAVKAGLLRAFMDGEREVTTTDIVDRARQIQPTSVVKREQVDSLRNWAKDHMAVDAGGGGITPIGERMNGTRALEM